MTRKCHVRFGGGTVEKRLNGGSPPYLPYHDRQTDEDGMQQLHTHVVLPGTTPSVAERLPVYNNKERGHDALFRDVATRHFSEMLDDVVGPEWRIQREEEPEIEQSQMKDPNDLDAWFGWD